MGCEIVFSFCNNAKEKNLHLWIYAKSGHDHEKHDLTLKLDLAYD